MDSIEIGRMTHDELRTLVAWAGDEGWMPGPDDADAFYRADPDGYFAARVGGRMIAGISAIRFGPDFGFLGLFICAPGHRSSGVGGSLVAPALEHLGGRLMGLDGVVEQQDYYARNGFHRAFRHVRYGGPVDLVAAPPAGVTLRRGTPELTPKAISYDDARFPGDRRRFLADWLDGARSRRWAAALSDGVLVGFGVIREAPPGHKIGPLEADSPEIAAALIADLTAGVDGPVFIDAPDANPAATALAEELGMTPVFECARMYNRTPPDLPLATIYSVCTLELG